MSIPLQFAPLYDGQVVFMRSDCLLDLDIDQIVYLLLTSTVCYEVEAKTGRGGGEGRQAKRTR